MIGLVGVSGLAGSGKTTAVVHLANLTGGLVVYLGQTVLDEISARGLPDTPENERQVRIDLRKKDPTALAKPHVDEVHEYLRKGSPVFVDAIFKLEEFELLTSGVPPGFAHLLTIDASFAIRSARLACRAGRPFNVDELQKRDNTELNELGTGAVIAKAGDTICNEGTFEEFYAQLEAFVERCG